MSTFKPGDVVKVLGAFGQVSLFDAVVRSGDDDRGYLIFIDTTVYGDGDGLLYSRFSSRLLVRVTE